jgi:uncharacterized protein Usg
MGFQTWRSTLKCMAHVYYGLVNDLGHFFKLKIWKRWKFHFICGSIIFKIPYIIHFLKMWKKAIQEVKSNVRWVSKIMWEPTKNSSWFSQKNHQILVIVTSKLICPTFRISMGWKLTLTTLHFYINFKILIPQ